MNGVIYTRVSTEKQETGTSLGAQFAACRKKAAAENITIVAHFEEIETGGAYYSRTKLQEALEVIENGDAQALIVYTLDRLSRDREHLPAIKRRVDQAGGKLIFCTQEFADTEEGELMYDVSGSFVAYERRIIRRRCMSGMLKLVEKGLMPVRSKRPYGYEIIRNNDPQKRQAGTFVIIESEASFIRKIFEMYAAGSAMSEIVRYLLDNKIPTMYGGLWRTAMIAKILHDSVYVGRYAYGKSKAAFDDSRQLRGLNPHYTKPVPKSEWKYIPTPPIITEEIWDRVQARLARNYKTGGRTDRKFMLTSLLFCKGCGSRLGGSNDRGRHPIYACRRNEQVDKCTYVHRHFSQKRLHQQVVDVIYYVASNQQLTEAAYKRYVDSLNNADSKKLLASYKRQVTTLRQRERAIIEAQIDAALHGADTHTFIKLLTEVNERIDVINRKIEKLSADIPNTSRIKSTFSEFTEKSLDNMKKVLLSPDIPGHKKNKIISLVISHVIPVNKKQIEVYFLCDPPFELVGILNDGEISVVFNRSDK